MSGSGSDSDAEEAREEIDELREEKQTLRDRVDDLEAALEEREAEVERLESTAQESISDDEFMDALELLRHPATKRVVARAGSQARTNVEHMWDVLFGSPTETRRTPNSTTSSRSSMSPEAVFRIS